MPEQRRGTGDIRLVESAIAACDGISPEIRPLTVDKVPGALLDFSGVPKEFYIVGDLHANIHNLNCILETDNLRQKLGDGRAVLILLGDLVHDDRTGYLTEMGPSLEVLEKVMRLIIEFPASVFLIQGNHDTFNPLLVKSSIKQGLLFDKFVQAERGVKYRDLVEYFFEHLPLFIIADQFLAVHAGPIRDGASYEHLVEARRYQDDTWQLLWNRINQIGSLPNNKEYTGSDIRKTKEILGVDPDLFFIVGHNPLHERGGEESIWFDVMGIKNYIIIYGSMPETCPILKFSPGSGLQYELLHADLMIKKSKFVLGDIY